MKTPKPLLFLVAAFAAFGALTPSHARAQVSVSFFYDSLDPYGEWVQDPDYGYCWHPTNVDDNWAPYTDGYWAYTDAGWTWVSYEDYGGVVYHYGRWARLPGEGWVWVPGYTWAPAWVSWRTNDDYVGWAPLPPEARWRPGFGFSTGVDASFDIGPGFYSFVGVHDFGAPALGAVIIGRDRNIDIIGNTTNITNITVNNSNVYVGGPSYAKYSALSGRPIPALKLVRNGDLRSANGKILSRQQGNSLMVVSPRISAPAAGSVPAPPKVAKTLTGVKADHGWDSVKDPDQRQKLQARIKDQAGSDTASPAKPVSEDDVKLVDEKIKTEGKGKTGAAGEFPSPSVKTAKSKKAKTPSTTDLLNAPATEEPGTAKAEETPKKSKKAKTPSEFSDTGTGSADETSIPKKSKSKKAKTPSEYDSGASDSETPSKHSKKESDSNLQPFMGGDESSAPKPRKSSEDSGDSGKSYESRSSESSYPAGASKSPKSGKNSKSDKKNKDEGDTNPPGQ